MNERENSEYFVRRTWRLLFTAPADGAWNMAVDEALLSHANEGEYAATLRLFAWDPACLSLGYAQKASDVDMDALHQRGWTLVRRPTGGRAILHTDELTYSIVTNHHEPRMKGTILESYRRVASALLSALHSLGIPAESFPAPQIPPDSDPKGPVCFEVPSNYEITWHGKKLIGSAQARRKEGVLQHGSLPLTGDLTRITEVLSYADQSSRQSAAQRLLTRAATAEDCLGKPLSWDTAAQALIRSFESILNLELKPSNLTESELNSVRQLVQTKFNANNWTFRV